MHSHARVLAPILAIGLGIAALVWSQTHREIKKISGFVESDEIRVGSRVGGRVREVHVEEGQTLQGGEVLIRLEPFDLMERLAEAESQLAAANAAYEKLKTGFRKEEKAIARAKRDEASAASQEAENGPRPLEIKEAEENLAKLRAASQVAEQTLARDEALLRRQNQPVDRERYDQSLAEHKEASASVAAQIARVNLLKQGTRAEQKAQAKAALAATQAELDRVESGYRAEEIAEAKAKRDAAEGMVNIVKAQIRELEVRAPAVGLVEAVELQAGDLIAANAPVVSILDLSRMRIRAYVPENQLGLVQPGMTLEVGIDSFPDRRFKAKVSFIARMAEFTPGNVQTPDERGKQVFRVRLDLLEGRDELRPGMAADVFLPEPAAPTSAGGR